MLQDKPPIPAPVARRWALWGAMSMALGAVNLHRVRHRAPPPEAITGFDRAYAALLSDLTAGGTA